MTKSRCYILMIVLLFFGGVFTRYHVLRAQQEGVVEELPFTLESALQFRLVRMLYEEGELPEQDAAVEYPDGVVLQETYTIGAEYVYAALAHLLPESMSLTSRVRWIALFWFCLGIPFMVLWVSKLSGSRVGGCVAGFFYAFAISSVIRSTGQELSHENFAFPLLLAHLFFSVYGRRDELLTGWRRWLVLCCSAGCLAGALVTWDMIQYYLYLWMGSLVIEALTGHLWEQKQNRVGRVLEILAVIAVAWFHPYMRAHGMMCSPVVSLGTGLLVCMGLMRWAPWGQVKNWRVHAVILLAFFLLGLLLIRVNSYGGSYHHFSELLWAKIRFLNRKPADPSLLTFNQRILWTPALNSASWGLTKTWFPAMFWLSIAALAGLIRYRKAPQRYETIQLISYYCFSFAAFILLARFHVYVSLFGAALLGCWMAKACSLQGMRVWVVGLILCFGGFIEACQTLNQPQRWGRPAIYYKELDELVNWLDVHTNKEPILANFGVSGSILAYAGNPIILHPKFETERIRERVEAYGDVLFKGREWLFRDWADSFGAKYYVFAMGEFSRDFPDRQMRYFVDALNPPAYVAARRFNDSLQESRYFRLLWENRKYKVFDILTLEEETTAQALSEHAYTLMCSGEFDEAKKSAEASLLIDKDNKRAQNVLLHVHSLRTQGVDL